MIELNGTASIVRNIAEARQKNGANINTDTVHMLKHCATEVVEAMEAYVNYSALKQLGDMTKDGEVMFEGLEEPDAAYQAFCEDRKRFSSELGDIVSCVLIIAAQECIDIEKAILDCTEKNRKRANKQGDKL